MFGSAAADVLCGAGMAVTVAGSLSVGGPLVGVGSLLAGATAGASDMGASILFLPVSQSRFCTNNIRHKDCSGTFISGLVLTSATPHADRDYRDQMGRARYTPSVNGVYVLGDLIQADRFCKMQTPTVVAITWGRVE